MPSAGEIRILRDRVVHQRPVKPRPVRIPDHVRQNPRRKPILILRAGTRRHSHGIRPVQFRIRQFNPPRHVNRMCLLARGIHVEVVISDYGRRLLRDELGDEATIEKLMPYLASRYGDRVRVSTPSLVMPVRSRPR